MIKATKQFRHQKKLDDIYQLAVTMASTMIKARGNDAETIIEELFKVETFHKYPQLKEKLLENFVTHD